MADETEPRSQPLFLKRDDAEFSANSRLHQCPSQYLMKHRPRLRPGQSLGKRHGIVEAAAIAKRDHGGTASAQEPTRRILRRLNADGVNSCYKLSGRP